MDTLDDHAIMALVKEGQIEKLGMLYERYKLKLFGFFYKMTREAATSEDLVQNVFVRVLKYKSSYRDQGSFRTWLFHIARNVSYDHFRKNNRYSPEGDMGHWDEMADESNIENDLIKEGELGKLKIALSKLPLEKQELIHMAKIDGLKYEEIANIYGCSVGTLKVRVHRTLSELKDTYHALTRV